MKIISVSFDFGIKFNDSNQVEGKSYIKYSILLGNYVIVLENSRQHFKTKLVVNEMDLLIIFEEMIIENLGNFFDVIAHIWRYLLDWRWRATTDLNGLWHLTSLLFFHKLFFRLILDLQLFLIRFNRILLTRTSFSGCMISIFLLRNLEYIDCWLQNNRLSSGKIKSIKILFRANKYFSVELFFGCTEDFFQKIEDWFLRESLLLFVNHSSSILIFESLIVFTNQSYKIRT